MYLPYPHPFLPLNVGRVHSGMVAYQGSCLCEAVNFELTGEPFRYAICHCYNCKVSGGGGFMANAFFKSQVGSTLHGIACFTQIVLSK